MEFGKEVIEIFDYIGEKFGVAIDWSSKNVLPYITELCQKLINWEIATSAFWIISFAILLIIAIFFAKWGYKKCEGSYDEADMKFCIILAVACLVFVFVVLCFIQGFDIIKCICFPELKIYEYLSDFAAKQ